MDHLARLTICLVIGVCTALGIAAPTFASTSTPTFSVLKDLNPGPNGSRVLAYTAVGNKEFFDALDSQYHFQLYATDGTKGGTVQLTSGAHGGDFPNNFAVYDGDLYFDVNGSTGSGLWKSNGTVAGTRLVSSTVWLYQYSAVFHGDLFFDGWSSKYGHELWRTDGAGTGTVLVKNIVPGDGESVPQYLTVMNNRLYFTALPTNDTNAVPQLFSSDGTTSGTAKVTGMPTTAEDALAAAHLQRGSALFMVGHDAAHGTELFISDGTGSGTHLVKDIYPGPTGSGPEELAAIGDHLFFDAWSPPGVEATWYTDGTAAGTHEVTLLAKPGQGIGPEEITSCGTHVFDLANDRSFDISPSSADGWTGRLATTNVMSYVCAGDELLISKGTSSSAAFWVLDVASGSDSLTKIAAVGGKSYRALGPLDYNAQGKYVIGFADVQGVGPEPVVAHLD